MDTMQGLRIILDKLGSPKKKREREFIQRKQENINKTLKTTE